MEHDRIRNGGVIINLPPHHLEVVPHLTEFRCTVYSGISTKYVTSRLLSFINKFTYFIKPESLFDNTSLVVQGEQHFSRIDQETNIGAK